MNGIRIGFLLFLGLSAQCAELSLDPVTAQTGSTVPIAVRFAAMGSQVAAVQFDLDYDPNLVLAAGAGPGATTADKNVYSAPLATHRMRVLVVGLNQYTLGDGVVVSLAAFANGVAGVYSLRLTDAMASDPDGNFVPLASAEGSVTVAEDTAPVSGIFPQVVSGGPWKTSLMLRNLSPAENAVQLSFWGGDGLPLPLPLAFSPELGLSPTTSATADLVIPPNGLAVVETESSEASTVLVGWARLQAAAGIVGSATFRYRGVEGQETETATPLETRTPFSFVLPFDHTLGSLTGVAVANGSDGANIGVTVRDAVGTELFTDSMPLPAARHSFFSLTDRYPRPEWDPGEPGVSRARLQQFRGPGPALPSFRFVRLDPRGGEMRARTTIFGKVYFRA